MSELTGPTISVILRISLFNQNYQARSIKSLIMHIKEMVSQQEPFARKPISFAN